MCQQSAGTAGSCQGLLQDRLGLPTSCLCPLGTSGFQRHTTSVFPQPPSVCLRLSLGSLWQPQALAPSFLLRLKARWPEHPARVLNFD